ncbi:hypothetical protein [Streptomyces pseudoechinosporeus]
MHRRPGQNLATAWALLRERFESLPDGIRVHREQQEIFQRLFASQMVAPPRPMDDGWARAELVFHELSDVRGLLSLEKLFFIHLVLAALLAAPHTQGRVLVLDELGDSLGQEHRREVLSAITKVATAHGITVLGTCQGTLMRDVAPVRGQILYFHYPSQSEYLNRPTRMFGYDPQTGRVELTADQLPRRLTC